MKEVEILPALAYRCRVPGRDFEEAAAALAAGPDIGDTLITHRFPLDACAEAFATAADRASGTIKVAFDIEGQTAGRRRALAATSSVQVDHLNLDESPGGPIDISTTRWRRDS